MSRFKSWLMPELQNKTSQLYIIKYDVVISLELKENQVNIETVL